MLIAQLSDIHIAGWGKRAYGIAPTAENLARCVDHINQLKPKPDLVLVTGDITSKGLGEEVERSASLFSKLRYPYYIIPGNHDDREALWSAFGGSACPSRTDGFLNYVIEGYDVRLVGMDSTIPGAPGGEICETRAAWLDKRLSEAEHQPTVIFMHHPPIRCGVIETDVDGFIGADRLGNVIEKYTNIERVICGHIHMLVHARWRGTVVSTAPSMGMQLVLDLTLEHPSEFTLEAPGYQLHYWTPEKNLITHTITVRETVDPYLFEDYREADEGTGR